LLVADVANVELTLLAKKGYHTITMGFTVFAVGVLRCPYIAFGAGYLFTMLKTCFVYFCKLKEFIKGN
jgi:hypothetical protein